MTQVVPCGQGMPQPPQLVGLLLRSTQKPEQLVVPVGHVQTPLVQTSEPPQGSWQKPQWFLSLNRSTHWRPHCTSGGLQAPLQFPLSQTSPGAQKCPHEPQERGFESRS